MAKSQSSKETGEFVGSDESRGAATLVYRGVIEEARREKQDKARNRHADHQQFATPLDAKAT
ncbi:MAG: hypothetical protein ABJC62_13145 [Frankiaceae bacterium]